MDYSIPKGTFDILPTPPSDEEQWRASHRWQHIEQVMRQTADEYGFKEIRTPLFERTELFVRGVGDSSDIVNKEMYTFLDRSERSMTLRPEGTASVMRSFLEKKLYTQPGLHKFFYIGPMFRYERPQAGRYRQHHQFGAEAIGVGAAAQDVELIDLLCTVYNRLGLKELHVQINSVGDETSRSAYKEALCQFLQPVFAQLSAESQVRFHKNVLRILDSKDAGDQALLQGAPILKDYLTQETQEHFTHVLQGLDALHIPYTVNPKLVRGLDYYNKTVFEITALVLGAQNAVGGGGRYDGLTESLGGPHLPSMGFGTGLERVLQTMLKQGAPFPEPSHPLIFFIPLGEAALNTSVQLVHELRRAHIRAEIDLSGKKIQSGLQLAHTLRATYALVLGDQELASGEAELKVMATRETLPCKLHALLQQLETLCTHEL